MFHQGVREDFPTYIIGNAFFSLTIRMDYKTDKLYVSDRLVYFN